MHPAIESFPPVHGRPERRHTCRFFGDAAMFPRKGVKLPKIFSPAPCLPPCRHPSSSLAAKAGGGVEAGAPRGGCPVRGPMVAAQRVAGRNVLGRKVRRRMTKRWLVGSWQRASPRAGPFACMCPPLSLPVCATWAALPPPCRRRQQGSVRFHVSLKGRVGPPNQSYTCTPNTAAKRELLKYLCRR